jgi:hypothetical protein
MQVLAATLPATVKVAQQNLKDTKVSLPINLQGYLAHEKHPSRWTLQ